MEPRQNTVVMAATNRPEAIDEALRRPGRFDREIVVGVPDQPGRREILGIHTRGMPLAPDVDLDDLARRTFGFVGADIAALTREAALEAVRRIMPRLNLSEATIPTEILDALSVEDRDFENALKRVQPSAMREVMVEAPTIRWDDVGGLDAARDGLREGVELPLKQPEAVRRLGIRPRQVAATLSLIDEPDSLVPARGGGLGEPQVTEGVVNTILSEMDGLEELQNIVVIGATNRPTLIDPALLRPGRFDELIYVGVPDTAGRRRILAIHTKNMPLADDVDLESIAQRTERFTGADLEDLVRRAGLTALRAGLDADKVTKADFDVAVGETRASVTPEMLE